jgi:hypothetical protein
MTCRTLDKLLVEERRLEAHWTRHRVYESISERTRTRAHFEMQGDTRKNFYDRTNEREQECYIVCENRVIFGFGFGFSFGFGVFS